MANFLNIENFEYDLVHKKIFLSWFLYYDEQTKKPKIWKSGYIALATVYIILFGIGGIFTSFLGVIIILIYHYRIKYDWNKNKKKYLKKINEIKNNLH